jgi:centractin
LTHLVAIQDLIISSVSKTDVDLRKVLYSEIYLSGGTTMLLGFHERLLGELKRSLPKDTKIKLNVPADRQYLCWLGGSLLVGLPTFQKMWITKKVQFHRSFLMIW